MIVVLSVSYLSVYKHISAQTLLSLSSMLLLALTKGIKHRCEIKCHIYVMLS